MNWLQSKRIKTWWNNQKIRKVIFRLSKIIKRLVIFGVIVNLIAGVYPEFPQRFSTIYSWFDGWLQLAEFSFKTIVSGIDSLFTGNFGKYWIECHAAFQELLQQFLEW